MTHFISVRYRRLEYSCYTYHSRLGFQRCSRLSTFPHCPPFTRPPPPSPAGNHWNGFSKGNSWRLKKVGLFPAYKVRDKLRVVEFPRYPQVPLEL